MALPKIDVPLYELKLPSTGEKIKYRPFTVKEEKILLVAQESEDPEQEILAAKQIVNNCLQNKQIEDIAMFDLEFILMVLRARSVNNEIEFAIKDPDTDETVPLKIDLDELELVKDENHTNKIQLNDEYVLMLKYPSIDNFLRIIKMDPSDPLVNYYMLTSCLDAVASEDEVHYFKEYTDEEVDQFMENLQGDVLKGIQMFFETMPKLRHTLEYTNKNGDDKTFVIEGTRSFFI